MWLQNVISLINNLLNKKLHITNYFDKLIGDLHNALKEVI